MTTHTQAERTEIAALRAAGLTQQQIATRTGVPRRSVGYILAHDQDVAQAVAVETREQITERMRRVHSLALAEVEQALTDPRQRLGDKVQALRVLGEQIALATGSPTGINANLNVDMPLGGLTDEENDMLSDWLDNLRREHPELVAQAEQELAEADRQAERGR